MSALKLVRQMRATPNPDDWLPMAQQFVSRLAGGTLRHLFHHQRADAVARVLAELWGKIWPKIEWERDDQQIARYVHSTVTSRLRRDDSSRRQVPTINYMPRMEAGYVTDPLADIVAEELLGHLPPVEAAVAVLLSAGTPQTDIAAHLGVHCNSVSRVKGRIAGTLRTVLARGK